MSACCGSAVTPASLDLALLCGAGALLSVGHCIGMCGPLIGAYGCAQRAGGRERGALAVALGLYHTGRLSSYAALGALFGLLGAAGGLAGEHAALGQAVLAIGASALMIFLGLGLLGLLPHRPAGWTGRIATRVMGAVRALFATRRAAGRFALGAAQGLLPCGPIYAVALAALGRGSASGGALALLAYGVGTLPVLFAVGFGLPQLGVNTRLRLHRLGAALVVLVAVQMGLRGLAVLELVPHVHIGEVVLW